MEIAEGGDGEVVDVELRVRLAERNLSVAAAAVKSLGPISARSQPDLVQI